MKKLYRSIVWLFLGLCFFCSKTGAAQMNVMVSIPPQVYFVEQLGGNLVNVSSMLPPGGFPHTYEPTPKQMRQLSQTDLYIRIHVEFEDAWWEKIVSMNPNMYVVDVLEEIEKREASKPGTGPEHHDDDPHIWLSPRLVKRQVAIMCEGLMHIDPDNTETYLTGKTDFLRQIDALDQEIRTRLANLASRTFLVFHPSWSYFAHDYNLEQLAIEIEGKEPSVAEMARIISLAKERNIRVIFVQPQTSRRSAETIARQLGATVDVLDPLAEDWLDNMRKVAQALAERLK